MYNVILLLVTDPILNVTVTPSSYSGLDVDPFNTFTLMCIATKPSSITPALDISWYHNEMQLDNSIPGISILEEEFSGGAERSSTLIVTSARTISSGVYACIASVSVPESNTVTGDQNVTVTIRGMFTVFYCIACMVYPISTSYTLLYFLQVLQLPLHLPF